MVARWEKLLRYSACDIADALLKLGVPGAGFLPDITPMPHTSRIPETPPEKVLAPASTFLMIPKATPSFPNPVSLPETYPPPSSSVGPPPGPYADSAERDTIVIICQPPGQSCAVMGGIMAARMKRLGVRGVVVDGRVRDLVSLAETGLPIWSKGTSIIGAGAETKVAAYNCQLRVGESTIEPGDLVMIDPFENGVVAVPKGKVDEVLELLPKLVAADEKVLGDVQHGTSVAEAFKQHRKT
ncbi:DlpA domain-containing protein [Bimuria novae-zelandiae CBS 107.79]|uniref:DlpA domain-containing protein n=1 Tax=Bimuria novae-zelandiae CBS 107.79 TaxID=1447943 RepID=A0A6A5VK85_9PLEO|nr:DlpA domain-containing protein [Bimuria novae-zelandiae CBS 107.79]